MRKVSLLSTVSSAVLLFAGAALAAPQGGDVTHGAATITQGGVQTTINQSTDRAVINWQAFSIGADETVTFNQPGMDAVTLNRVTGADRSVIDGALNANGKILLINPNGVLFGKGASIDVGGIVATTSDISDANFMAGNMIFDKPGKPGASVINEGTITAANAGLVGLVAPHVRNSGVINARLGQVELAAGTRFTLDLYGDDLVSFAVDAEVTEVAHDAQGNPVAALVHVDGAINASGGTVQMTARAARDVVNDVIIAEGSVVANNAFWKDGAIVLDGGENGIVKATGAFDASGTIGGRITLRGESVYADGEFDASGAETALNGGRFGFNLPGRGGEVRVDATGRANVGGLISVSGGIGGEVSITASGLSNAGVIAAQGLRGAGGTVDIATTGASISFEPSIIDVSGVTGGSITHIADGKMTNSGQYRSLGLNGVGGNIDISADHMTLLGARLDASGALGGGRIRIGGEYQGGKGLSVDELANAQNLFVGAATQIKANAVFDHGAGGEVILWADNNTVFLGDIEALPGTLTGEGGFVEVSAAGQLSYAGEVATGIGERTGTLLLDPKNLTIINDRASKYELTAVIADGGSGLTGSGFNKHNQSLGDSEGFGSGVALDGQMLAVGVYADGGKLDGSTNTGAVYLYTFSNADLSAGLVLQGIIGHGYTAGKSIDLSSSISTGDFFGWDVSLDNNRLAVSSYGGDGAGDAQLSSGEVLLFTFTDNQFAGGAHVGTIGKGYVRDAGVPSSAASIDLSDLAPDSHFGNSVSLDGARLAVGAVHNDNFTQDATKSGVYLFTFTDDTGFDNGAHVATIGKGRTGANDIDVAQVANDDSFGSGVALDDNRLVVTARGDGGAANSEFYSGAAYLFTFADAAFSGGEHVGTIGVGYNDATKKDVDLTGRISAHDGLANVDLEGTRLVIGAVSGGGSGDSLGGAGEVYILDFDDTSFSNGAVFGTIGHGYTGANDTDLSGLLTSNASFGSAIALDGENLVVGARFLKRVGTTTNAGGAFIFRGGVTVPTLSNHDNFTDNSGGDSEIFVSQITDILSAGTALSLQANNDLTVDAAITVNNTSGHGGKLTLNAGRSVLINKNITTDNGGLEVRANVSGGVIDAHREAGNAVITMADGVAINAGSGSVGYFLFDSTIKTNNGSGDITLREITAGDLSVQNRGNGNVSLAGTITASGAGTSVIIAASGGNFTNNSGAISLSNNEARFLIYSQNPTDSTTTGLTATPYYDTSFSEFAPDLSAVTGSRFVYTHAPTLTVTVDDKTRAYGAANPALTAAITGYINGDATSATTGEAAFSTTADANTNAGTATITASRGTLANDYNYGFTFSGGTLTIDKIELAFAVDNASRAYGDANPAFSGTFTGFVNGDTIADVSAIAYDTLATAASGVGAYDIGATGITATNYTLGAVTKGTLTVGKRALAFAIDDVSRAYGDANPAFSGTLTGFVNGDTVADVTAIAYDTLATAASDAGTYDIGATGITATNYTLGTVTAGTLTIDKIELAFAVDNASRAYGDANPAFSGTFTGFVNGDTIADVSAIAYDTLATAASGVGAYDVSATGITSTNYTLGAVTAGTLTVGKRALAFAVDNASRAYGDANPAFSGTFTGFVNGDTIADVSAIAYDTLATAASGVGAYDVSATGITSTNYTLGAVTAGTLTVGKRALAFAVDNASRAYGDANPAFSGTLTGFVNGDTVADVTAIAYDTLATTASDAGTYDIGATGITATNYTLGAVTAGTLTIDRAPLTVTADDTSRDFGEDNPVLTGVLSGFVNGDDASVVNGLSYNTTATSSSAAGAYAITSAGGTATNYEIVTRNDGVLTVNENSSASNGGAGTGGTDSGGTGADSGAGGVDSGSGGGDVPAPTPIDLGDGFGGGDVRVPTPVDLGDGSGVPGNPAGIGGEGAWDSFGGQDRLVLSDLFGDDVEDKEAAKGYALQGDAKDDDRQQNNAAGVTGVTNASATVEGVRADEEETKFDNLRKH